MVDVEGNGIGLGPQQSPAQKDLALPRAEGDQSAAECFHLAPWLRGVSLREAHGSETRQDHDPGPEPAPDQQNARALPCSPLSLNRFLKYAMPKNRDSIQEFPESCELPLASSYGL